MALFLPTTSGPNYQTSFALTENPLSEGGAWKRGDLTTPRTNIQTDGLHAFATMSSFDGTNFPDSVAIRNQTYPDNQFCEAILNNSGAVSGQEWELLIHGVDGNTAYEFDLVLATTSLQLVRWDGVANAFTTLASISAGLSFSDGARYRAAWLNGVLMLWVNQILVLSHDTSGDSSIIQHGSPGMGGWNDTGVAANCTKAGWRNYRDGSL